MRAILCNFSLNGGGLEIPNISLINEEFYRRLILDRPKFEEIWSHTFEVSLGTPSGTAYLDVTGGELYTLIQKAIPINRDQLFVLQKLSTCDILGYVFEYHTLRKFLSVNTVAEYFARNAKEKEKHANFN